MIISNKEYKNLTIAGPGAGKTTNLVQQVILALEESDSYRDTAVITYTNSAATKIRNELKKKIKIPPNLFIGTIHSFFNHYIFLPYAYLFKITITDPTFIDDITIKDRSVRQSGIKKSIAKKMLSKGIVHHDMAVEHTYELLQKNESVRRVVAAKLRNVFIDEYQDAMVIHHEIFELIYSQEKTNFFFIGDPEQYIYSFAYTNSLRIKKNKKPSFNEIPILALRGELETASRKIVYIQKNYRSSANIISFLNKFNGFIQQSFHTGNLENIPIYFINENSLEKIIDNFNSLCGNHDIKDGREIYHLAREEKTLREIATKKNMSSIANDISLAENSVLLHALDIISSATGVSQKEIRQELELSRLGFKVIGMKLLKEMKKKRRYTLDDLRKFILSHLSLALDNNVYVEKKMNALKSFLNSSDENFQGYCSTIHKAKGMEADAVLALAKTRNELMKWLEEDKDTRQSNTGDTCREGFVAFSRARKLLCISCVEIIPDLSLLADNFDFKVVGSAGIQSALLNI